MPSTPIGTLIRKIQCQPASHGQSRTRPARRRSAGRARRRGSRPPPSSRARVRAERAGTRAPSWRARAARGCRRRPPARPGTRSARRSTRRARTAASRREDRHSDQEEAPAAELVREPAHRDEQHREHDVVGVQDPRDVSTARVESRWSSGIEMFTIVTSISAMKRPIITTPQMRQRVRVEVLGSGVVGGLTGPKIFAGRVDCSEPRPPRGGHNVTSGKNGPVRQHGAGRLDEEDRGFYELAACLPGAAGRVATWAWRSSPTPRTSR